MTLSFHNGKVVLHAGDCVAVLKTMPDCTIDAVVTDPPYGLKFMGREWDKSANIAFTPELWAEVLRVLKPGGHMVCFGGTRTYHRMVCAIEDAGFEIRDAIMWHYGSGFPKSHDVSKGIDKAAGAEREIIGPRPNVHSRGAHSLNEGWRRPWMDRPDAVALSMAETAPATDAAREWHGWGTALKPSTEIICLARKPLSEGTVAANVLRWGTGAINVDACRIPTDESTRRPMGELTSKGLPGGGFGAAERRENRPIVGISGSDLGRFPANLVHDGSPEVLAGFPESGAAQSGGVSTKALGRMNDDVWRARDVPRSGHDDNGGSAARFFACFPLEHEVRCSLCNALTATSKLSTQNTQTGNSARSDVPGSPPRESAAMPHRGSASAINAEHPSSQCHQPNGDSAQSCAQAWPLSSIVQNVKDAAGLCDSCATDIARGIVEVRRSGQPAQLHFNRSIDEFKKTILSRCLASYVESRESTDTILTTENLSTLFGCAFSAIDANINSARAGSEASSRPAPSRLWYSSKADAEDRVGSCHPTVKPVDLMQWLVRLICPKGGTVLDPFAGTGTTAAAAFREGCRAVLIEREAEYLADIERRMGLLLSGPDERARKLAKPDPHESLPLFGGRPVKNRTVIEKLAQEVKDANEAET